MKITGEMLIGASAVRGTDATAPCVRPRAQRRAGACVRRRRGGEVARACELAEAAFDDYTTPTRRSKPGRSFWKRSRTTSSGSATN